MCYFKRLSLFLALVFVTVLGGCHDNDLKSRVDDLENRIVSLEKLCAEMNTNISSMQGLIDALRERDYVTGVAPVMENGLVIGYTVTFGKGDPITLYHGKNGLSPEIAVAEDTDGVYYWKLNGKWLLDDEGNKLRVSGKDGLDGKTPQMKIEKGHWYVSTDGGVTWQDIGETGGEIMIPQFKIENKDWWISWDDGANWQNMGQATGEDGTPGTTPDFKIEDGCWYVSTDRGLTWQYMGQATGDDGVPGRTPDFKIEDGRWYVSMDEGLTWQDMGGVGGEVVQPQFKIEDKDWWISWDDGVSWQNMGQATGNDGAPGEPGVSPEFKIENGDWWISWDDGVSWQNMGQATGDDGAPGTSGVIPEFKIENGRWYVSVNGGQSWQDVGSASGDSFLKDVDNSAEDYVDFIFSDGTVITLSKKQSSFSIRFSDEMPFISSGETIEVNYSISGDVEDILVETVVQNGWQAEVIRSSNLTGKIKVTAPKPITDDKVLVFISDGKEKTAMSVLPFCIVVIEDALDNMLQVSGQGGDLYVAITSNLPVTVSSEDSWIGCIAQSKALMTNVFRFKIQPNRADEERLGHVLVKNDGGKLLTTITIVQKSALDFVLAREREILKEVYNSMEGVYWTKKTNWNSDRPVGDWYGVTTDEFGQVIGLELGENNLQGQIPKELAGLENLQSLVFSSNKLTGTIPIELCDLKHLSVLYLGNNQLSGTIPEGLWDLKELRYLSLGGNQLSGSIPEGWGDLTKLNYLNLSNNQLTGEIPLGLGNSVGLRELALQKNNLSGPIPSDWGNFVNLEKLYLGNNQLTSVPEELGNLSLLSILDLNSNQLSNIPGSFGKLSELFMLYLNDNKLQNLPDELVDLSKLSILELSGNEFTSIPPVLCYMKGTGVYLSDNRINYIPEEFFNSHWMGVFLSSNNLTGNMLASFAKMPELKFLDLSDNYLAGEIPLELCLKPWSSLWLANNNLTGNIPKELSNSMQNKQSINFKGNRFYGKIPDEIVSHNNYDPSQFFPQQDGYELEE